MTDRETTNWACKICGDVLNSHSVRDHTCDKRTLQKKIAEKLGWTDVIEYGAPEWQRHVRGIPPKDMHPIPDCDGILDGRRQCPLWLHNPVACLRDFKVALFWYDPQSACNDPNHIIARVYFANTEDGVELMTRGGSVRDILTSDLFCEILCAAFLIDSKGLFDEET